MCTAMSIKTNDGSSVFGRNLDVDREYGNCIIITPRNKSLKFKNGEVLDEHLSIIGSGIVFSDYPLYFDACNENGLAIAGLNFPGNAYYNKDINEKLLNIATFELIPYILGKYSTVDQVIKVLENINICDIQICDTLPNAPLHWMISDKTKSIVVEAMNDGIHIYDNKVEILTNNPPFEHHLSRLEDFGNLSPEAYKNINFEQKGLKTRCVGNSTLGMPGDFSSSSRFIRGALILMNLENDEKHMVSNLYHALGSVMMYKGLVYNNESNPEWTVYTSVINQNDVIYTYKRYDSLQINSVNLFDNNINSKNLILLPMDI